MELVTIPMIEKKWKYYAETWSLPEQRRLKELATANITYQDPTTSLTGAEALSNYMGKFQTDVPGGRFEITEVHDHHGQTLAFWQMVNEEGSVVMKGQAMHSYQVRISLHQLPVFSEMSKTKAPEFVRYMYDRQRTAGDIKCSRYFGGWGFRTEGELFAIIMGQMFYFRVDKQLREELAALGFKPFSYKKGERKIVVKRFYTTPERCIHDTDYLQLWVKKAIKVAISGF